MKSKTLKRAAAFAIAFIVSLGTIYVLPEESLPTLYFTAFAEDTVVESGQIGENVVIENGVTTIGDGVFAYCQVMESITIPDSVTSIGVGAFSGCIGLKDVKLTENVSSIDHHAFQLCEKLAKITIPSSKTVIEGEGDCARSCR